MLSRLVVSIRRSSATSPRTRLPAVGTLILTAAPTLVFPAGALHVEIGIGIAADSSDSDTVDVPERANVRLPVTEATARRPA